MRLIDADTLIEALKIIAPISDAMRVMWGKCLIEVRNAPTITVSNPDDAVKAVATYLRDTSCVDNPDAAKDIESWEPLARQILTGEIG